MADSDDEYDKKFRDKFRGERTEPTKGVETRRDDRRPRDEWIDRDRWSSSRGRGEYRTTTRERYSPGRHETPPVKRMRNSWEDNRRYGFETAPGTNYYGGWPQQSESQAHNTPQHRGSPATADSNSDTPTTMMTLKAFMNTLDDQISDEDALKKYTEYKLDFQKQQINQFFVAHKDEEWFKEKYHPEVSAERKKDLRQYLEKRLELFVIFLEHSVLEQMLVDVDRQEELVRLMDAFVIRLEGGTDLDLESLDGDVTVPVIPLLNDGTKRLPKTVKPDKKKRGTKNNGVNEDVISINDEDESENKEEGEEEQSETSKENGNKENEEIRSDCDKISDSESGEEQEDSEPKPRALHRTCSIFLKSLPPIISRKDIEEVCKSYDGMLRIALADPQPDRKWSRRGWVTFKRDVDIKDICWSLSSARIKDVELSPIINKDIVRRVRTVSSMTCNKHVLRNDIKLCTEIIRNLDRKNGLWQDNTTEGNLSSLSGNPVLKNIANYLVEEVSAEEDALLGVDNEDNEEDETDPSAFKVLDKMLLYLRLVYSVDYYNHCEYPNEDEMPHRCGIIHARFSSPNKVTSNEVSDYCTSFKNKLNHLLDKPKELSAEELTQIGLKDPEAEVEKFIKANTQEIGPSKWLCPLSGKKFKGPEFVLKHIMNKHEDKVEEVKKEVEYFNNYLKDSKRPQFSDQGAPKGRTETHSHLNVTPHAHHSPYSYGFGGGVYPGSGYNRGHSYGYSRPSRGAYGGNRGSTRGGIDYRPIVNYRDLDAPNEPDEFI